MHLLILEKRNLVRTLVNDRLFFLLTTSLCPKQPSNHTHTAIDYPSLSFLYTRYIHHYPPLPPPIRHSSGEQLTFPLTIPRQMPRATPLPSYATYKSPYGPKSVYLPPYLRRPVPNRRTPSSYKIQPNIHGIGPKSIRR